ncbi:MAG: RloB domain-containing protein [Acidobacteria bacterium]|nr:RloB domain-containing protein [Acidobacteriota bacterium]
MKKPTGRRPNRRIGVRTPRRIIRVHLEGEVTEKEYFGRLASLNKDVQISFGSSGSAPMTLVKNARDDVRRKPRRKSDIDFDEIWCVFDVDDHVDVERAIHEARAMGAETAVSNPCFELWLVLHEESITRHVERREVQRRAAGHGLVRGRPFPRQLGACWRRTTTPPNGAPGNSTTGTWATAPPQGKTPARGCGVSRTYSFNNLVTNSNGMRGSPTDRIGVRPVRRGTFGLWW